MKKTLSLFLVMTMLMVLTGTVALAGSFNESGLPIVDEPITISIAVKRHGNDASASFNDKYVIKRATEATNIQIKWDEVLTAAATERVPVILASGDLPDVFLGLLTDSQIAQNPSLFVPLNDLIELYCPNIMELYETSVPGWKNFLTYPDGNIYGLMGGYLVNSSSQIDGAMYINQTWLDKLGLAVPTTMDELYDVLVAFRDGDPLGDGTKVIPMDMCQTHYAENFWMLARSYGIPGYGPTAKYDIQDGKVIGTVNTDNYRRFLEDAHRFCAEGLINIEGLTQTYEQFISNVGSMKVGAFWGWAPYTYITDAESQAQYVPMAPVLVDGITPRVFSNSNLAVRNNLVITTACEDVEAVLRWYDYLAADQIAAMEGREGPVGLNFFEGEDGLLYSRTPTADEAVAAGYGEFASNIGTSTWAATMGLTVSQPLCLSTLVPSPGTTGAARMAGVNAVAPYFTEESMVKAIIPPENQEELDFATEGLNDYVEAFLSESILGGVTDESWNAYLAQLSAYGYEFYLSWYQDYYDGAF